MYRELQPFRETLSRELKASLFPAVAGVDPNKLLETYLDRLTMFTGVDVADQTFTALALDAGREILGSLEECPNQPDGFQRFLAWARALRDQHGLRIIAVAGETTGIYYWALWDFLGEQVDVARVLYNPRTTEHMGEVLSKKVRNELVDALLLAEQLRLGSTPEVLLQEDAESPDRSLLLPGRSRLGQTDQPQEEPVARSAAGLLPSPVSGLSWQ